MEKSIKICSGSIPLPQKFPGKRNAALSYGADYGIILYHKIMLPVYGSGNLVRKHMKHGLIVFLVSMVPLIELRGAIPYGVAYGMPLWLTYLIAIVGNMLPVPFIYLFARKILLWGKDKPVIGRFFTFCLEKGERGGQKLQAKAGRGLFWALLLFVGIPLPGTGAWTGTLAASLLDMGFKKSVLACMGGVLLAGCIMGILSVLGVSAFGAVVQSLFAMGLFLIIKEKSHFYTNKLFLQINRQCVDFHVEMC